ncbi:hypothetical protein [Amycolatopsis sp. cmx-4-61]|uniref:hypothetical protein n=1 Tax=Amycolatopsis sp. cmx-4-61 TaxID=2790937 RepID=UPI00397CF37D
MADHTSLWEKGSASAFSVGAEMRASLAVIAASQRSPNPARGDFPVRRELFSR